MSVEPEITIKERAWQLGIKTRTSSVANMRSDTVVLVKNYEVAGTFKLNWKIRQPKVLVVCPPHIAHEITPLAETYQTEWAEYEFARFHNYCCAVGENFKNYALLPDMCPAKVCEGLKLVRGPNNECIQMQHTGGIDCGEDVLVLAGTVIHRAVFDYTVIGSHVRIGSLCNIGHNAVIGDRTFIMSGVNVGGSVKIGSDCFIGLSAVILPHLTIHNRTMIGAGSVVTKNLLEPGVYYGNPARWYRDWDGKW